MTTREKEIELSMYLTEWFDARNNDWNEFKRYLNRDKRNGGIYSRFPKDGGEILQFVENLIENLNEHLSLDDGWRIIPSQFASIKETLKFLERLDDFIKKDFHCIERHFNGPDTDMDIAKIANIWYEYHAMYVRCMEVYSVSDDIPVPYQCMMRCLYENNINGFIQYMKSAIKNVPYNIHKEKMSEGYFHTIVHVILSILGIRLVSEAETNDGRIDVMVDTPMRVYIMEFKYDDKGKSKAQEGLQQIKDKKYAEAYFLYNKEIVGIGVSFSEKEHNINDYIVEVLYSPTEFS